MHCKFLQLILLPRFNVVIQSVRSISGNGICDAVPLCAFLCDSLDRICMHILSSHRCEWELIIIILLAASNSTLADNVALKETVFYSRSRRATTATPRRPRPRLTSKSSRTRGRRCSCRCGSRRVGGPSL